MKDEFIFTAANGDEEIYYDMWLEAYQQACTITIDTSFKTEKEYNNYILDLANQIYKQMLEDCE